MKICGCVPLEPVQVIVRLLLEQLKSDEYCPYELRVSMKQDNFYEHACRGQYNCLSKLIVTMFKGELHANFSHYCLVC